MYPKPKSAPPRIVQSKFVKNKTNAMKEIEAWVKKDDDPLSSHEASRMSGQLTDNVTEERMLRSKLWELSKERYKFLAQNAYEKKMFQDRIQRKSSALLRRASSSSTVDRQPEGEGVSRAKQRWKNARLALLDRLDPTKHKDKVDGKQAKEGKPGRRGSGQRLEAGSRASGGTSSRAGTPAATGITVAPAMPAGPVLSPIVGARSLPVGEGMVPVRAREDNSFRTSRNIPPSPGPDSRNVKFNKMHGAKVEGHTTPKGPGETRPQHTTSTPVVSSAAARGVGPRSASSPSFFNRPRSGVSSKPSSAASKRTATSVETADSLLGSWVGRKNRQGKYGMRLDSMTKDPRYSQLEKSLAPVGHQSHKHAAAPDVKAIVNTFDALHMPPRRRKEAKPKTELKALEYMEERGFVF
ncbi:hypothetical protein BaRGS_00010167 [Batillaria attramentaria]|uniref:Clr5 domain-containing protein n=1 Tax=Batillaria attramentaria TaxID=370345 RepID=A0ABD0LHJ4_9CAEN